MSESALDEETKVKFKSFNKQKSVTGSVNPHALFTVTSTDGEWLKLEKRFEVHHSEVTPHKKETVKESSVVDTDLYNRSSKEHHTKFADSHKRAAEKSTTEESKSLHTRGMNLHLKAIVAGTVTMSKTANDYSKAVKNGDVSVPGIDHIPQHIKDDEMNRRYSSPGAKFRK